MSIGLRTNIAAVNAIRRLDLAGRDLSSTYNRLSSGLRIVNPSDDAAGLAIGTSLKADSRVYAQGIRNVNDGISILNIAEGGLSQLAAITIRQKELAEQAANGVYSGRQRLALDAEADALTKEYNRIIRSLAFGGSGVIDGINDSFTVQQGYGSLESTLLSIGSALGFAAGDGINFTALAAQATGGSGDYAVSGDIDGDGDIDVVAVTDNTFNLVLRLNDGNGNLTSTSIVEGGVNGAVTIGDFNNDGVTDIVRSDFSGFYFYRGTGGGSFAASVSYSTPSVPANIISNDFNGDGILDIAYRNDSNIGIALGNGDGTFRVSRSYSGSMTSVFLGAAHFTSGDVNNDGVADIVSTSGKVFLGNGDGSFGSMINLGTFGLNYDVELFDLDGDGNLDIIDTGNLVLYGNGNGTFSAAVTINGGIIGGSVGIADYNGDGIADLAIADASNAAYYIHLGNGNRTFRNGSQGIDSTYFGQHTFANDMNGDGIPDITSINFANVNIQVLTAQADSTGRRNNHAYAMDLRSITGAREALTYTTAQLIRINQELGKIGALQSRLSTSIQNIQNRRTNYEGAASQIMDVDVADESAKLTSRKILQQGATAVLGQANQQPQLALTLLRGLAS